MILYYELKFNSSAYIIETCQSLPGSGLEVIHVREAAFGSAADAAAMLDKSLDHLAATDWASLGTQAHGEMLALLQRAQTRLTAVNAAVSLVCARCSRASISPCAWVPSEAQSVAAR